MIKISKTKVSLKSDAINRRIRSITMGDSLCAVGNVDSKFQEIPVEFNNIEYIAYGHDVRIEYRMAKRRKVLVDEQIQLEISTFSCSDNKNMEMKASGDLYITNSIDAVVKIDSTVGVCHEQNEDNDDHLSLVGNQIAIEEKLLPSAVNQVEAMVSIPSDRTISNKLIGIQSTREIKDAEHVQGSILNHLEINFSLSHHCIKINKDLTKYYTDDAGYDNVHNNFWSFCSFEQLSLYADEYHGADYISEMERHKNVCNHPQFNYYARCFITKDMREKTLSFLFMCCDRIVKDNASIEVFSNACSIFDRFLSLECKNIINHFPGDNDDKQDDQFLGNSSCENVRIKKRCQVGEFVVRYLHKKGMCSLRKDKADRSVGQNHALSTTSHYLRKYHRSLEAYYQMLGLASFYIAVKHDCYHVPSPKSLISAWEFVLKEEKDCYTAWNDIFTYLHGISNLIMANCGSKTKVTDTEHYKIKELLTQEIRILLVLGCETCVPTAAAIVTSITCNRILGMESSDSYKNEIERRRKGTEAQLMLRLLMLDSSSNFKYKPSVQALAATSLANGNINSIAYNEKLYEFDFFKNILGSGVVDLDVGLVQECRKDIMLCFLKEIDRMRDEYRRQVIFKEVEFSTLPCKWLSSLCNNSTLRSTIISMKDRFLRIIKESNLISQVSTLTNIYASIYYSLNDFLYYSYRYKCDQYMNSITTYSDEY